MCLILFIAIGTSLWAAGTPATTGPEELLEITWNSGSGNSWTEYPDNPVSLWIQENMNIKLVQQKASGEQAQAMKAAGDLTDMWMDEHVNIGPLVEAGYLVPLNDLMDKYGNHFKKIGTLAGPHIEEYWAQSDGNYYGLPAIGPRVEPYANFGGHPTLSHAVRWDYYNEIGAPRVSTIDDWIDILVQMVENHPTTEEGLRVYGMGSRPAAEMWETTIPMCAGLIGCNNIPATWGLVLSSRTGKLLENYGNPDGPLWTQMEFWYKQVQAGIFDPDMLLVAQDWTSRDTIGAKAAKGQYVALITSFVGRAHNALYAEEGKGFVSIPWDGGGVWGGSDWGFGSNNSRSISANADDADRVFQFLDWGYSEEANRLFANGVPGLHWDVVDGMATLRQGTIDLWKAGGEAFAASGINQMGWGPNIQYYKGADGQELQLFATDSVSLQLMTATDKDFAAHYGFETPRGYWKSLEDARTITTHFKIDYRVQSAMSPLPDELKLIEESINRLILRGVADIIQAPDDATYEARKAAMIGDIEGLGFDKVRQFVQSNFDELSAKFGPKPGM